MNSFLRFTSVIVSGMAACASAQTSTFSDVIPTGSQLIRDYDYAGFTRTIHVPDLTAALSYDVTVSLKLESTEDGTVLGDYYAYLFHEDQNGARSVVLLNRVGTSDLYPAGYTDDAMDVTFRDDAAHEIHSYRIALGGPTQPPLAGPLTGVWQPDGRTESPFSVNYDSPRTQTLADFSSMSPEGEWTLFIADVSFGGIGRLTEWSLGITPVPEPSTTALLCVFGGLASLVALKRRNQ